MREVKMTGVMKLDMELANLKWRTARWQKWCLRNNCGLIIEDGRVKGYEPRPKAVHI